MIKLTLQFKGIEIKYISKKLSSSILDKMVPNAFEIPSFHKFEPQMSQNYNYKGIE